MLCPIDTDRQTRRLAKLTPSSWHPCRYFLAFDTDRSITEVLVVVQCRSGEVARLDGNSNFNSAVARAPNQTSGPRELDLQRKDNANEHEQTEPSNMACRHHDRLCWSHHAESNGCPITILGRIDATNSRWTHGKVGARSTSRTESLDIHQPQ